MIKTEERIPIAMPKYLTNRDTVTQKQNRKQSHANQREHPRDNMVALRRPRIATKRARLTIARLQRIRQPGKLCERRNMIGLIIRRGWSSKTLYGKHRSAENDSKGMHCDASQEGREEKPSYSDRERVLLLITLCQTR
jgi:hypothetical protein